MTIKAGRDGSRLREVLVMQDAVKFALQTAVDTLLTVLFELPDRYGDKHTIDRRVAIAATQKAKGDALRAVNAAIINNYIQSSPFLAPLASEKEKSQCDYVGTSGNTADSVTGPANGAGVAGNLKAGDPLASSSEPQGEYTLTISKAEHDLIIEGLTQREMWGGGDALVDRLEALYSASSSVPVRASGEPQEGLEAHERANFLLQIRVLKAIVEKEGDPDKLQCLADDIERWRLETQTALRNLRGMNKRVQREIRLREHAEAKLASASPSDDGAKS